MWLENDDENNPTGQTTSGNNLSVGAGGGSTSAGGQTANGQSTGTTSNPSTLSPIQSNKPQQQFATVQDYLGSNQSQGNDLGQKFTAGLTEAANTDKSGIDTAVAGAQNEITSGAAPYDANLVQKAVSDPTSVANDPNQLSSFLKQWNASYSGPSSFEASDQYTPAATAANDASQKAAELSSAGGQQQILHDQFGVYGQGNQGLDQALLQNSSAYPTVQTAAPAFQSLNDYLTNKSTALDTQAQQAQTDANAAKTNTQNAFANSLTGFQTDLNNRTTAAQQQAKTQLTQYQNDLASGDPAKIQADLTASGVDPTTVKNITSYLSNLNKDYGITPPIASSYIGNPNVDINASTVATPEDYAKAAALGKLTGQDFSGVLNPADVSKAGTGTLNQNAFKSNDLQSYLKQGLDIQDQSVITGNPTLKTVLPDINDFKIGSSTGQQYVDAFKRNGSQGYGSGNFNALPPAMQSIANQALQTLPAQDRDLAKDSFSTSGKFSNWLQQLTQSYGSGNTAGIQSAGTLALLNSLANYAKGV